MTISQKGDAEFWLFGLGTSGKAGSGTNPTPPTLDTCTSSEDVVTLTWTAPTDTGGSAITAYVVWQSTNGKDFTAVKTIDGLIRSCQIPRLTFNQQYTFYVTAANAIGSSDPSNTKSVTPTTKYNVCEGGEIVDYEAGGIRYRLHKFVVTGTFKVIQATTPFEIYVLGGGGGGGFAGGGAGALIQDKSHALTPGNYLCTVGGPGGGGRDGSDDGGGNGGSSNFPGLATAGGGGGGAGNGYGCIAGAVGACGGGSRSSTDCGGIGGAAGTQGNPGGGASGGFPWNRNGGGGGIAEPGQKDTGGGGKGVILDIEGGPGKYYGHGGGAPHTDPGSGNGGAGGHNAGATGGVLIRYARGAATGELPGPSIVEFGPDDAVTVAVVNSATKIVENLLVVRRKDVPVLGKLLDDESVIVVPYDNGLTPYIGKAWDPQAKTFAEYEVPKPPKKRVAKGKKASDPQA